MAAPDALATFTPERRTDLALTLAPLRRSGLNPSVAFRPDGIWRAARTPAGPAGERLREMGGRILVEAWGPGAAWLVERAPVLCGSLDEGELIAVHPLLARLQRSLAGLRMARTEDPLEALVASISEQKVPGLQAWRSHRSLVLGLGERAPGPVFLMVPPAAETLAELPYHAYHRFGLERRRAEAIRFAAARSRRLDQLVNLDGTAARRWLTSLPGVGAWTAAEVARLALGDADAVSVGDYHLPHVVSYALEGERKGSDARMLELLEPYRGQRGRVQRLLEAAGVGPPRRGPRLPLVSIAGR